MFYRGQCIIGYRKSMGGDNRWHAQVVLAGGSSVDLDERRELPPILPPAPATHRDIEQHSTARIRGQGGI